MLNRALNLFVFVCVFFSRFFYLFICCYRMRVGRSSSSGIRHQIYAVPVSRRVPPYFFFSAVQKPMPSLHRANQRAEERAHTRTNTHSAHGHFLLDEIIDSVSCDGSIKNSISDIQSSQLRKVENSHVPTLSCEQPATRCPRLYRFAYRISNQLSHNFECEWVFVSDAVYRTAYKWMRIYCDFYLRQEIKGSHKQLFALNKLESIECEAANMSTGTKIQIAM